MDFSSPSRALISLERRRPPLDADMLSVSQQMLWPWKSGLFVEASKNPLLAIRRSDEAEASMSQMDDAAVLQNYTAGTQTLLGRSSSSSSSSTNRWEALAVGLFCATDLLTQQTQKHWPACAASTAATTSSAVPPPGPANAAEGTMIYMDGPRVPTATPEQSNETATTPAIAASTSNIAMSLDQLLELAQRLHQTALEHLEHKEPRVRTLVAKAVGANAALLSAMTRQENAATQPVRDVLTKQCQVIYKHIVASIVTHIEEGRKDPAEAEEEEEELKETRQAIAQPPTDASITSSSSMAVLDDTTGWRALETNWQCLACLIQPLGSIYLDLFPFEDEDSPDIDNNLLQHCHYSAVEHVNRHVRAAAMLVLEHWIRATTTTTTVLDTDPRKAQMDSLRNTAVEVLKHGLADNWSQVRMAASVLCRVFFLHFYPLNEDVTTTNSLMEDAASFLSILVPRMCLNRFYLAQGVKLYSHETWRMVFGNHGLALVTQYVGPVCRYYTKMCDANNHVVREAGCQAIAELAVKLGGVSSTVNSSSGSEAEILERQERRQALQAFVPLLLQTLLMCFHDESWPVRDEACLACGIFCKSYPEECRVELNTLWERWTEQLTDQIWSVREDAAVALGDALEAYGAEFLSRLLELIKKIMPGAKDQPALSMEEYKRRQNDIESHTDAQLYSCGSLAPKLSKKSGAGRIGCSSCGITRPKSPWEATDGCIYLIRELVLKCCNADAPGSLAMTDNQLLPLMTELVDACRVQHFPQADDLRATLWRQLPAMAQGLGKQRFKRLYLDVFLDLLMSNLERTTASQLSKHAAGQCAEELANLVGQSIFRGRLDDYQQRAFDQIMQERQQIPKGPVDDGAFSPFGPPGLLDHVVNNAGPPKSAIALGPIGYP